VGKFATVLSTAGYNVCSHLATLQPREYGRAVSARMSEIGTEKSLPYLSSTWKVVRCHSNLREVVGTVAKMSSFFFSEAHEVLFPKPLLRFQKQMME
jgi:hypothetical protein